MDPKLVYGFLLFIVGQTLAWFQLNSQFVWKWWENKPLLAVVCFGLPVGICFWYATKLIMASTAELWTARFFGFAASYISFPVLTWWLMNESPFTAKTIICSLLAFAIIIIQLFWR